MKKIPIWLWIVLGIIFIPILGIAGLFLYASIHTSIVDKNVEFIVPDEIVVGEASDEANCINWFSERKRYFETRGEKKEIILTGIKRKEGARSENAMVDYIEGDFKIVNSQGKEIKRKFSCAKDMGGDEGLGKYHGGLFLLMIDGDIKEQDIDYSIPEKKHKEQTEEIGGFAVIPSL